MIVAAPEQRNADEDFQLSRVVQDLRGRQQHPRDAQRLGELLSRLLSRRGYAQIQGEQKLGQLWREAAGVSLAAHSRPGLLRRGVLEIVVRNSASLQELSFQKKKLLAHLQQARVGAKITDLRFRIGVID